MIKKTACTLIILATCILYGMGQEQPNKKQRADALFERYEYAKSLNLYLQLAAKNKPDVKATERVATCYYLMKRHADAEEWYARVINNPKADWIDRYNYAEVLLCNAKFAEAKAQYKTYFSQNANSTGLARKLASCDSAAKWIAAKSPYMVKNVEALNTEFSDWGLNYVGKTGLVFISDRSSNGGTYPWTGNGYLKLYSSGLNAKTVDDLPLNTSGMPFLKNSYHIGPMVCNAAGDTAYITITTGIAKKQIAADKSSGSGKPKLYTRRLELIIATKTDGEWGNLSSFIYNNVNEYSVGHAALSSDGRVLYFTSDMPGGEGKTDIWYCEKQHDGSWGKPVNCGKTINTADEEAFPEIGGDGNLYYSSKGLPGMGGFDIYRAKGEKSTWAQPVNLKWPINSTSDDFCLITRDGASGYFSSDRAGGQGSDDIYSYAYTGPPMQLIAEVPPPKPPDTVKKATPVTGPPPTQTTAFRFTIIYYDLDKANIRPDAALELDKLVITLNQNPQLKIELSSYCDSRASVKYNIGLSQRRAISARAYLLHAGIAPGRLIIKYFGKSHLANQCADSVPCTETEHQLNRRTEFRVVGD